MVATNASSASRPLEDSPYNVSCAKREHAEHAVTIDGILLRDSLSVPLLRGLGDAYTGPGNLDWVAFCMLT